MANAQAAGKRGVLLDQERHRYTSLIPPFDHGDVLDWRPEKRQLWKKELIAAAPANMGHVALFVNAEETVLECVKIVPESYVELARRHPYDYSEQPLSDHAVCAHMQRIEANGQRHTVGCRGVFLDPPGPPPPLEPAVGGDTIADARRRLERMGGRDDASVRTRAGEAVAREPEEVPGRGRRASTGEHGRPGGARYYYLCTEYCPMGSLLAHLTGYRPNLPLQRRTLQMLSKQLLLTVDALHRNGFCHLDISADNVLLVRVDNKLECRLTDFAQAQRLVLRSQGGGFQPVFGLRGKGPYRAPEVPANHRAEGYQGVPVDVYAAANVILDMAVHPWLGRGYVFNSHTFNDKNFGTMFVEESVAPVLTQMGLEHVAEDRELVKLLDGMLRYKPTERLSIRQCLQHPFFAPP